MHNHSLLTFSKNSLRHQTQFNKTHLQLKVMKKRKKLKSLFLILILLLSKHLEHFSKNNQKNLKLCFSNHQLISLCNNKISKTQHYLKRKMQLNFQLRPIMLKNFKIKCLLQLQNLKNKSLMSQEKLLNLSQLAKSLLMEN